MTLDMGKQRIGRYWGEQAATFDEQFLHSIATDAERRAWRRILDLLAPPARIANVVATAHTLLAQGRTRARAASRRLRATPVPRRHSAASHRPR